MPAFRLISCPCAQPENQQPAPIKLTSDSGSGAPDGAGSGTIVHTEPSHCECTRQATLQKLAAAPSPRISEVAAPRQRFCLVMAQLSGKSRFLALCRVIHTQSSCACLSQLSLHVCTIKFDPVCANTLVGTREPADSWAHTHSADARTRAHKHREYTQQISISQAVATSGALQYCVPCSVLQGVALSCSVLQCLAMCCSVLKSVAVCRSM